MTIRFGFKGGFMHLNDIVELLKDRRVIEEIHKHLWIESQKAGYNIGVERATEEWIYLYAQEWMRYNSSELYAKVTKKRKKKF